MFTTNGTVMINITSIFLLMLLACQNVHYLVSTSVVLFDLHFLHCSHQISTVHAIFAAQSSKGLLATMHIWCNGFDRTVG